ncbi:hypothetical protein ACERII_08340 [Evansella sp. AB-rgal1]|uniref:hypothetical protein n=1 Tax=Evansella sp. AB-rgal1 TaxID=3242696 RepID=UPI00359CD451
MKKNITLFLFSSILLLISCHSKEAVESKVDPTMYYNLQSNNTITFLFSNDERIKEESSYYDALLEFKRQHPDHIQSINFVTEHDDAELARHYEIKTYPTLLVIYDQNVKVRIEGYKESFEIYNMLEGNLIYVDEETS